MKFINKIPSKAVNLNKNIISNDEIKINIQENEEENSSSSVHIDDIRGSCPLKEIKKRRNNKSNPSDLLRKERESFLLLSYNHSNPQYKRRKIKIGMNHQCDIYEYTDKYEKQINFDEEEYERNQLKQVWSVSKNPFSKEEIDKVKSK